MRMLRQHLSNVSWKRRNSYLNRLEAFLSRRGLEGALECLGCGLELAKTMILRNTFFTNQGFNAYASTAPPECFLGIFELIFEPS